MPERSSQPRLLQYVGVLVAIIAVVGYVVFGWRFGETESVIPFVIGGICVVIAICWTLYQRVYLAR